MRPKLSSRLHLIESKAASNTKVYKNRSDKTNTDKRIEAIIEHYTMQCKHVKPIKAPHKMLLFLKRYFILLSSFRRIVIYNIDFIVSTHNFEVTSV